MLRNPYRHSAKTAGKKTVDRQHVQRQWQWLDNQDRDSGKTIRTETVVSHQGQRRLLDNLDRDSCQATRTEIVIRQLGQ